MHPIAPQWRMKKGILVLTSVVIHLVVKLSPDGFHHWSHQNQCNNLPHNLTEYLLQLSTSLDILFQIQYLQHLMHTERLEGGDPPPS